MRKLDTVKPLGGKKIKVRSSLPIILYFFIVSLSFSDTGNPALTSGLDLFLDNNPESAISWFELALKEDFENGSIYNYLGISYEQINDNNKAIETYKKGLEFAGELKSLFLTNIANNLVIQGKNDMAIDYYTQAVDYDNYGDALRNRAGEYLHKQYYSNALQDYQLYLAIEENPYQETEIKRVISLLELKINDIARKELEEERKRLEAEEKQRELLSQVLNSLSSAGNDTTNLSAGTETVEDYANDFDIVE
jgi:tetratricopeptide (TPR) repeat protein